MLKSRLALAALIAAMLSIFAAPGANAASSSYDQLLTVAAPSNVEPGTPFQVTFKSEVYICDSWTLIAPTGVEAPSGTGISYTVTLTAPSTPGASITASARCDFDTDNPINPLPVLAPISNSAQATYASVSSDALLAVPGSQTISTVITTAGGAVASDDDDDDAALPDTGGSNVGILALGAGLLIAGAGVTVATRRRKA